MGEGGQQVGQWKDQPEMGWNQDLEIMLDPNHLLDGLGLHWAAQICTASLGDKDLGSY